MDWSIFGRSEFVASVAGLVGVLIGSGISAWTTRTMSRRQLEAAEKLALQKFQYDRDLAERKFELDRSQLVHKRRFELADALLADAYRFHKLMAYVRNGGAFGNEGETRKSDVHEPESIKRTRDGYFVPIERLQKESEFISGLMAKQHTARAHFGADAENAFKLFGQSMWRVQGAAEMLIETTGEEGKQEFKEKLRRDISAPFASYSEQGDEVGKQIDQAVALIERICSPALEWKGE